MAVFVLVKYLGIERIGNLGVDAAAPGEPRNYLVVGSDEREDSDQEHVDGRRSDTLIVVRVDASEGEATTLSIPRDLVVPITGTGEQDRINSAYAIDRNTLLDTVRDVLGIEVHHYLEVDFSSFEDLVDALGGVDIWLDQAIKDDASGLLVDEPGCVTLDGEQALAYVRARQLQYLTSTGGWSEPDPTADLGRIERQQVFLQRALTEVLDQAKANPARLPELVDVGVAAVALDDHTSVRELLAIAEALDDLDPDEVASYPLPVVERGDGATLAMDEVEAEPVLAHFRDAGHDGDGEPSEEEAPEATEAPEAAEATEETSASTYSEFIVGEPSLGEPC